MVSLRETDSTQIGRPAAGVVLIEGDRVLLVKHGPKAATKTGMIGIPGGRVRPSETTQEAAKREFKEETGLTLKGLREYPHNIYRKSVERGFGQKLYEIIVFIADEYEGELKKTEETEPIWVKIPALEKRRKLLPSVTEIITDVLKYNKQ